MSVGYLPSTFDLINVRDLDLISQAVARCSRLVVGVLSDESVEGLSGRPPVVPLLERMALVRHVRGVDEVVVHESSRLREMDADSVVFAVLDEPAPWSAAGSVMLTPARESKSVILRNALAPVMREAVA